MLTVLPPGPVVPIGIASKKKALGSHQKTLAKSPFARPHSPTLLHDTANLTKQSQSILAAKRRQQLLACTVSESFGEYRKGACFRGFAAEMGNLDHSPQAFPWGYMLTPRSRLFRYR